MIKKTKKSVLPLKLTEIVFLITHYLLKCVAPKKPLPPTITFTLPLPRVTRDSVFKVLKTKRDLRRFN